MSPSENTYSWTGSSGSPTLIVLIGAAISNSANALLPSPWAFDFSPAIDSHHPINSIAPPTLKDLQFYVTADSRMVYTTDDLSRIYEKACRPAMPDSSNKVGLHPHFITASYRQYFVCRSVGRLCFGKYNGHWRITSSSNCIWAFPFSLPLPPWKALLSLLSNDFRENSPSTATNSVQAQHFIYKWKRGFFLPWKHLLCSICLSTR